MKRARRPPEGEWLDHEQELRAADADDIIPKPLELERLFLALDRLARDKRPRACAG